MSTKVLNSLAPCHCPCSNGNLQRAAMQAAAAAAAPAIAFASSVTAQTAAREGECLCLFEWRVWCQMKGGGSASPILPSK